MQFPIIIGLHRSFLPRSVMLLLLLASLAVALFGPFPVWVRGLLLIAVLAIFLMHRHQLHHPVHSLMLSGEGSLSVRFSGKETEYFPVVILPSATVYPWLTVLRLEYEGHPLNLLMTPDAIDPEAFRRLRLWLCWRANFLSADAVS